MAAAKKPDPKPATKDQKAELPAVPPKQELSTYNYGSDAGMGYEATDQDDFAMPYLSLLQAMSPEIAESTVDGAKPGMLINSVTKELFDGKEGVFFVPVATQHYFVEWRPKEAGGGIVGRHEKRSELVKNVIATGEFGSYKTPEGNDLTETFYMIGYLLSDVESTEPSSVIVVGFTSTKIKVYKAIMQTLRTVLVPAGDRRVNPPLFANRLRIRSVSQKNNQGTFFNFDITPALGNAVASLIPPTTEDGNPNPLLAFGRMLHEQVTSGQRKMADESLGGDDSGDTRGSSGGGGGAPGKPPF